MDVCQLGFPIYTLKKHNFPVRHQWTYQNYLEQSRIFDFETFFWKFARKHVFYALTFLPIPAFAQILTARPFINSSFQQFLALTGPNWHRFQMTDTLKNLMEQRSWHYHLCHLKYHISWMFHHFGTDFYQFHLERPERPVPYLVWQSQSPQEITKIVG